MCQLCSFIPTHFSCAHRSCVDKPGNEARLSTRGSIEFHFRVVSKVIEDDGRIYELRIEKANHFGDEGPRYLRKEMYSDGSVARLAGFADITDHVKSQLTADAIAERKAKEAAAKKAKEQAAAVRAKEQFQPTLPPPPEPALDPEWMQGREV